MSARPSIPKGTRDFSPEEMLKRNFIFDNIKEVFSLYGYQPIETPAMENLTTLLGKYGEEGDKLLFRILNSGDYLSGASRDELLSGDSQSLSSKFCEKGLRYDLTVPFARYVVQHRDTLSFPFKRYQIQPVWRADRPQKGRYREFFQCDVDVVGSDSLLNEYELVVIIGEVFKRLGVNIIIKINNRKVLTGIAEYIGEKARITDITVAIDKLDKIGLEAVNAELAQKGLSVKAIEALQPVLNLKGSTASKLDELSVILSASEAGLSGIAELRTLFSYLSMSGIIEDTELDLTLARGLNYYTGAIFEVKARDVAIGSICGGGRYDNLTGVFGLPGVSGVGVSFGADRIYDVMTQLAKFDQTSVSSTEVMFVNFGADELPVIIRLAGELRNNGLKTELYPDNAKLKKQISYADAKKIPFIVIAGNEELMKNCVTVKNMTTGLQEVIPFDEITDYLLNKIRQNKEH